MDACFILNSFSVCVCVRACVRVYKKERINGKSSVPSPHQQSVIVILKTNMDTGSCSIRSLRFDEPKRITQGCGNSISLVPNQQLANHELACIICQFWLHNIFEDLVSLTTNVTEFLFFQCHVNSSLPIQTFQPYSNISVYISLV